MSLISVRDLTITFGDKIAVDHVSFDLFQEKLGIVGESGSGKTLLARALMGLLPVGAHLQAEKLTYQDTNLLTLSPKAYQRLRGRHLTFILQDPKYGLNPNMTVGAQIQEMFTFHLKMVPKEAKEKTLEALNRVLIPRVAETYGLYPHEVSGGMGQRIMIAMMLAVNPKVLIADEPTSSLDPENRTQFLDLVHGLIDEHKMAMILISHDLPLVQQFCDRILVLYQGRLVETIRAQDLEQSTHPYTQGLLHCIPRIDHPQRRLATLDRSLL